MLFRKFVTPKALLLLVLALFLQNCAEDDEVSTSQTATLTETELAINVDQAEELEELGQPESGDLQARTSSYYSFNTLNQALHCTGLNEALFSGHKTIYAPSDAAFAKLGLDAHNVCEVLDTETLTNILLYHVVDDFVSLRERGCVEMLNGDITQVAVRNHRLFINDSRIYLAFNQKGRHYFLRVYAINEVLEVPEDNIVETASGADQFSVLVDAVLAADPAIAEALSDEDAIYTVFAPTNEAFVDLLEALGVSTLDELVAAIGVEGLSTVLLYHVVDGCAFSNDLKDGLRLETLQGEKLKVDLDNLSLIDKTDTPAGLDAEGLDILTSNGIVHTIDKVLLPDAILQNL